MFIAVRGIKAWIIGLLVLAVIIFFLVLLFNLLILLLPVLIILILLSYLFRVLNKLKKEQPKSYVNIKYKIKK